MEIKGLNISWGSLWRVFFMIILAWIIFMASDILIALFLAIVISSAIDPWVSRLEFKRIPRILSTLIVYIIGIFIIALIIYTVVPLAISELNNLLEVFDIAFDDLIKQVRKVENKKHDK